MCVYVCVRVCVCVCACTCAYEGKMEGVGSQWLGGGSQTGKRLHESQFILTTAIINFSVPVFF